MTSEFYKYHLKDRGIRLYMNKDQGPKLHLLYFAACTVVAAGTAVAAATAAVTTTFATQLLQLPLVQLQLLQLQLPQP